MIPKILIACVSIHAPHEGERRKVIFDNKTYSYVSIHAPHEGERRVCAMCRLLRRSFNPRSPRGGATHTVLLSCSLYLVSIHAPHEGERHAVTYTPQTLTVVSIHAPHEGERLGGRWCTA